MKLNPLQIPVIFLALATAIIHLALGIPNNLIMFILNGIGYILLVTALYLPQIKAQRGVIRWVLIGYTAATILGWVLIGDRNVIGYIDKLIEILLIIALFIEGRQESKS